MISGINEERFNGFSTIRAEDHNENEDTMLGALTSYIVKKGCTVSACQQSKASHANNRAQEQTRKIIMEEQ